MNERELFIAALQLADDAQRSAFLNRVCAGDSDLRRRVAALLAAFNQAGSFLQPQAPEPSPTLDPPPERSGLHVGPYKLIEKIGEGGMGTVWMAQQSAPVKRMVAIKLIKAGLDSHQVIARFEAERQALALMDHANIARVLDAGATPAGRPYFVMDLVRGVPITRYCDEHHLTPRERLELFIPVCQAVQHAHQKGIIHRDLKPSNVLVAQCDGRPVPKVIDFGVAKAAGQSLTDKTLVTGFGTIVGTLEYMSPEQAEADQLDIDTRSDIYSLGVLLYELLTGSTPFSRKELEKAGMLEMLRVIREQEPSKPSTKLSTAEGLPTLAANRGTEPARLTKMVRGELDWIVMKALEKDRNRRYETANGFALDVQRYLADEHVLACPPSAGYRLRKFARRYKGALATTAIVAAALILGTVISVWQAVRATNALQAEKKARRDAEIATEGEKTQRGVAQQQKTLAEKNATRAEANFGKARKAVEEYLTKITENELLRVPGLQPLREDLLKAALKFYIEFTQERAGEPGLRQELASAHLLLGRIQRELDNGKAAKAANLESIRLYEQLRADAERGKSEASVEVQVGLATGYFFAGRYDDTEKLCQHVLQIEPKHAEIRGLLSDTYNELGKAASDKNDVATTFKNYQQAFDLREGLVRDFPDNAGYLARLGGTLNNLGNLLNNQRQYEEALAMFERSIDYTAQAFEREPHSILWGRWLCIQLGNAATQYHNLDRREQELATVERLVAVSRKRSFENPAITSLRGDLYQAYLRLGTYQKQVGDAAGASKNFRLAREVLEQIPRETPKDLFELATVYAVLASPPAEASNSSENQSDADERQRNADLAIATLHKAVAGGYQDVKELAKNKDFDSLRGRGDFQEILATTQKVAEANQKLAQAARQDSATKLASQQQAAALLKDIAAAQPGQERHRTTLATTLQSIGMVQTGLKQFEAAEKSLNDAIALWRELAAAQPNNSQLQFNLTSAQMALGTFYRESGRAAEAHRTWQECLVSLDQVRQRQPADTTLGKQIALKESQICDLYGRLGAFSLAAEYSRRSVRLQRSLGAWPDVDYGVVLGVLQGDEALRELCRVVDRERTKAGGPPFTGGDLANLGKVSNLVHPPALPPEQSLKWIEESANANPDQWHLYLLALAQYRAGKTADAQATFEKVSGSKHFSTVFAGAIIAHGAGQKDLARERLKKAEAIFVQFCQQTLQGSTVGFAPPIDQGGWWELTAPVLLRREAWRVIEGQAVPEEAWLRLMEARAAHLLGDSAKRDEQLAAADSRDSNVWLARARLTEEWGQLDQSAEAAWQRAIDAAPADPVPWIHRGRWYAQRGEQAKADADFAKAASLTPDTLNRFLQAGWWVAGPYPKGLKEFCPPEVDPDPSRPVHFVDPKTGLSEQPLAWRPVPSGETGKIDLRATFNADQISAYALNIIYSPAERPATLRVSADGGLRLWLNGELLYEADLAPTWQWANEGLVPVTLRAGRNLVVVKVSQGTQKHSFSLRVSDEAVDRGFLLAEWGLWKEAAEQMALAAPSDFREDSLAVRHAELLLAANDVDGYRRYREWMLQQIARLGTGPASSFARACALAPDETPATARLIQLAEKGLDPKTQSSIGVLGYALYRGGRYDEAIACLREVTGHPTHDLVLAMALFRRGDSDAARQLLTKSQTKYDQDTRKALSASPYMRPLWNWREFACFQILYREARALIEGAAAAGDQNAASLQARASAEFARREALTADFDQALMIEPKQPRHWLARGRRLAELGRFDEAQADFNKAVELDPTSPHVLAARALHFADLGESAKAAADFHRAFSQFDDSGGKPRWYLGVPIDLEVARRDEVFERLTALRPQDPRPLLTRMVLSMQRGDIEAARLDAQRLASYTYAQPSWLAAAARWRGDDAEFARLRASSADSNPNAQIMLIGLAPTDEALTAKIQKAAESMWREQPQDRWHRRWLGVAQLRAGHLTEAVASLEASLDPGDRWEQDRLVWPLLAIAHHQLKNAVPARRWLNRTEYGMGLGAQAGPGRIAEGTANPGMLPEEWLYGMVFYLEAKSLIDGPDAAHTERERLAALAREWDQATLAKADAARQQSLAKVEAARQESLAKVEAAWNRAVELAGDNPLPWIQRGRWHAERGEQAKADADFAKAASLTSGELNKFLEAGWWIVGPYPLEVKEFCPPEIDPDPSRPVHTVDPKTGLSNQPVPWKQIQTGRRGAIDLSSVAPGQSAYLMALIGSPAERTLRLDAYTDSNCRVWINGRLVGEIVEPSPSYAPQQLPFTLAAGRNVILIKVSRKNASPSLRCQLGDSAESRMLQLARDGLWRQTAALAVTAPCADLRRTGMEWSYYFPLLHLEPTAADYELHCREFYEVMSAKPGLFERFRLAIALALQPNKVAEEHSPELIEHLNRYLGSTTPEQGGGHYRECLIALALLHYRKGELDSASNALDRVDLPWQALVEPVRALIAHQRGLQGEAANWYQKSADSARARQITPTGYDWSRVSLQLAILLREAEQKIRGRATESDRLLERWRQAAEQRVRARDASTSAYDEVLYCSGGRTPEAWLARGRRLAELGRLDEAQADFNKAVELSPKDSDVLAARAVFLADAGQPVRAAADFQAALNLLDDAGPRPRYRFGVPIDLEIAQRDDVFDQMNAERLDRRLLITRIVVRLQQGDVDGARSDVQRLSPIGWATPAAAANLSLGNRQAFERIRDETPRNPRPEFNVMRLGLAPTAEPQTAELLEEAERMWQEHPNSQWHRRWLGLAQLRAGQFGDAAANLEASLAGDNWQSHGITWPLLAMAHHHLGNKEAARRWLDRTAKWQKLRGDAESRRVGAATGTADILPEDLLYAMVFDREARSLIDGPDAARTERERPPSLAPDRTKATLAKVEAAWNRAVELAGDNPLPWIQRGRWYAQRGEREKADTDFTKAASLTRGELNKFLQAGWWIVGPYPPNIAEFCPPQVDPDPAKPVHLIDPQKGLSAKPAEWHSVPSNSDGQIDLASLAQQNQPAAAYALAYVYSPADETRLLRLSRTHDLRVWVNGVLALDMKQADFPPQPLADSFHRMPIALRAGRNVILIKTPAPTLTARIADTPMDRVNLLAEQRRFHAACEVLRESAKAGNPIPQTALNNRFAHAMALENEPDLYQAFCEYLVTRKDVGGCGCALLPNPTFEKHQATLISTAEAAAAAAAGNRDLGFRIFDAALIHYRAGNLQQANQFLVNFSGGKGFGVDTLRALLAHRSGEVTLAEQLLDEGLREGRARLAILEGNHRSRPFGGNLSHWWYQWACYLTLLREAEQAIRHRTTESQALIQQSEELATRQWMADPEMVAFDHPLTLQPNFVQPERKYPHYFLVHGQRLSELGRFAEAEADFNKAVEFTPGGLDALVARARFHAQRGDVERAVADFGAALKLVAETPEENYTRGLVIGRELASDEAVFAKAAERWPDDYRIWLGRGMRHAAGGRWKEALQDYSQVELPQGFFVLRNIERACLQWLAGDLDGYRQTCQGLLDRKSEGQTIFLVRRGILVVCGIAPEGCLLAPDLAQRAEQLASDADRDYWVNLGMALALYRCGRFDEAWARCEKTLGPNALLDDRLALQCLRAMCLHRLGRTDEARPMLEAAQACLSPEAADLTAPSANNGGYANAKRLVSRVLLQQATQVLDSRIPDS